MLSKYHSVNKKFFFFLLFIFLMPSKFTYSKGPSSFFPLSIIQSEAISNRSKNRFFFGISYFNAMRQKQNAIEGRFEYRSSLNLLNVSPFTGISFASSGAFYWMAGFYSDIPLGNIFMVTPGFAAGYFNKGLGIDLASEVEFRTQIEFVYVLENNLRIGIGFYHISNGNFGKSNPGAESLSFIFSLPVEN
jgi:hypothetical protein